MELVVWLQQELSFLNGETFILIYSWVIYINPMAILPQLRDSSFKEPKKLLGVSVPMFFIFLIIQVTIALGAIRISDTNLFVSMSLSAILTSLVIIVTLYRRRNLK